MPINSCDMYDYLNTFYLVVCYGYNYAAREMVMSVSGIRNRVRRLGNFLGNPLTKGNGKVGEFELTEKGQEIFDIWCSLD